MTANNSEDLSGNIIRGCVVCGTLETEMDGDPVTDEIHEIDGHELDSPYTRLFCSTECKTVYETDNHK